MPYQDSAPTINPNTFPYRRKWTQAEIEELLERIEKFRRALVDAVGPSGVLVMLDYGTIANLAVHLALAGGDVHTDERQYIWRDDRDSDDLFEVVRWHIRKDVERPPDPVPEPADADAVAAAAVAAREQIQRQLPDDVRELLIANIAKEFQKDTTEVEE